MIQTEYIRDELSKLNPGFTFEIVNFDTKGDKILDIALVKIGDKGLFTKELEDALELKKIDFVVHSLKDLPCQVLPDNLSICGIPERANPLDALVIAERHSEVYRSLDDLPNGSIVGTSSLRRIAQLKARYPRLKFENIRGNLNTRFKKMDEDKLFDAIILAVAGVKRLGFGNRITQELSLTTCMHAVGQGALGVECRSNDAVVVRMLNEINDETTVLRCIAERTFLASLNGGCSAPIGVNTVCEANRLRIEGKVLSLDGSQQIYEQFEVNFDTELEEEKICPLNFNNDIVIDNLASSNSNSTPAFTYILDKKVDAKKQVKAEFCGRHLGSMLIAKGADRIIEEAKIQVKKD